MFLASHNATQVQLAVANQVVSHEDLPTFTSTEDSNSDYEDIEGPRVEVHVCLAQMQCKLFGLV